MTGGITPSAASAIISGNKMNGAAATHHMAARRRSRFSKNTNGSDMIRT
jgi:hypothetical protein